MYAAQLSNLRYAVIETRWTDRPAEHFAVEYYCEESLRELIAGTSIIGSGFMSRQEALAAIPASIMVTPNTPWRTDAIAASKENRMKRHLGLLEFRNRFTLQRIWMIPSRLAHQVAAALVLIVCSKNVFSVALRVFIGF